MSLISYSQGPKDLSGSFIGVVVDNRDPDSQGRVKCSIPGLLDLEDLIDGGGADGKFKTRAEAVEALPWVYKLSSSFNDSKGTRGVVSSPNVGSTVLVQFPQGSLYFPVYVGVVAGVQKYSQKYSEMLDADVDREQDARPPQVLGTSGVHGIALSSGSVVSFNDITGDFTLWHSSSKKGAPTEIKIDPDGNVSISSSSGITIKSARDMNFIAQNRLRFNAPVVNFDCPGSIRFECSNITSTGMFLSDYASSGLSVGINGSVSIFNKGTLTGLI